LELGREMTCAEAIGMGGEAGSSSLARNAIAPKPISKPMTVTLSRPPNTIARERVGGASGEDTTRYVMHSGVVQSDSLHPGQLLALPRPLVRAMAGNCSQKEQLSDMCGLLEPGYRQSRKG
jgi:hypothetical protein